MGSRRQQGFTIIELILVVSISAVLTVGAMVGWTVTINTQNYKDSVQSFASILQQQYTNTLNVTDSHTSNLTCNSSGVSNSGSTLPRGQSSCVIMGRAIEIDSGNITVRSVLGYEANTTTQYQVANDGAAILGFNPKVADDNILPPDTQQIPWSSQPYFPTPTSPQSPVHIAVLIIRSPVTGTVHTYVSGNQPSGFIWSNAATLPNIISGDPQEKGISLCLDPNATITQGRSAVTIGSYAASSSAVSISSDKNGGSAGC